MVFHADAADLTFVNAVIVLCGYAMFWSSIMPASNANGLSVRTWSAAGSPVICSAWSDALSRRP